MHPLRRFIGGENGFMLNPLAAAIFLGLVLVIVIYSILDRTEVMTRLGPLGPLLPLLVIVWLMVGIYLAVKRLKRHAAVIRVKGPLYMRSLMNDCLERTCGMLASRLNAPDIPSATILNDILTDKMLHICATDCLRYSDIRRQIESSRIKGTTDLELAPLFQTAVEYGKQELPSEIRQVADTVTRSRPDLKPLLEGLKKAHRTLYTGTGNILSLLPPDPKKVARIRATYRYRPPNAERSRRMAFALETVAYLKATRHENVNPMDRKRYETVAAQVIPKLGDALTHYKRAWKDLVDAYEQPMRERSN
jgi:hypothetical protein